MDWQRLLETLHKPIKMKKREGHHENIKEQTGLKLFRLFQQPMCMVYFSKSSDDAQWSIEIYFVRGSRTTLPFATTLWLQALTQINTIYVNATPYFIWSIIGIQKADISIYFSTEGNVLFANWGTHALVKLPRGFGPIMRELAQCMHFVKEVSTKPSGARSTHFTTPVRRTRYNM